MLSPNLQYKGDGECECANVADHLCVERRIWRRIWCQANFRYLIGEVKSREVKKFSKDEVIEFEKKFAEGGEKA
jgi:hypothetical protein